MMNTIFYLAFCAICFVLLIGFLDWLQSLTSNNSDLHPKDDPDRPRQVQLKPKPSKKQKPSEEEIQREARERADYLQSHGRVDIKRFFEPPTNADGSIKFRNDNWRKDRDEG